MRVIFLIPTPMIIIQYMLNYVNGNLYNILRLVLYIFVIFTFIYPFEKNIVTALIVKFFDVKYIPFGR